MTETTPEYHEDKAGLILSNVKQDINNNIGRLDDPEWQAMAGLQVARAQAHATLAQSLRLKALSDSVESVITGGYGLQVRPL